MKGKWIEHVKTAILVTLVVISFVLTGSLWFSSAPSNNFNPYGAGFMPPYIFNEGNYNKKNVWQLAAPFQLFVHRSG
jgi:regulatory protein YycH of two-component signal transduction system YycFG